MNTEYQAQKKFPLSIGLLAHVDAGKTTLSEALLYTSGARRTLGRVDHRDSFLDTYHLERTRGITIFSKQALLETENLAITLVDTPGHVDFSGEAERVMPVVDCAILVISGTDGVQAHTATLWHLLERYQIPAILFLNKMDLPSANRKALLAQLQQQLHSECLDFSLSPEEIAENVAMCDEQLLDNYLKNGVILPEDVQHLIAHRKIFPVLFGSALKLEGIQTLLRLLNVCAPHMPRKPDFGAKIYKISRDPLGTRLTWMKVTGGKLKNRSVLRYVNLKGDTLEEKVVQLRIYSGEKYTTPEEVSAGQLVAVAGLTETRAGQGLGCEAQAEAPVLEPVMTYRINLPAGADPSAAMQKLRQLEEEEPLLHLLWDARNKQIQVQIMGKVQLEIFRNLVAERFSMNITLDSGRIFYKETIANPVEGVGHFEPLRHYAEVHLLLEPLPPGSGLVFDSSCPTDVLDMGFQNLVLSHLAEKNHVGVLTGSPITDMKITLLAGRAHLKHTEGGDFRQAACRAVRQGLMQAETVLLEPWYDFILTVPAEQIGRAITDIRSMGGNFDAPEPCGVFSILKGQVPASELDDYPEQVAAYSQGRGQLQIELHGYCPCHNQETVAASMGYQPEADVENTPDSVFCGHGAGFPVKWDQVFQYMHLESGLKEKKEPQVLLHNFHIDDKELEAIMEREFGPVKRPVYRPPSARQTSAEPLQICPVKQPCVIVDGYNIIYAWDELSHTAASDLEAARRQLCDLLSSYAGFRKYRIILVFDGYKVKGNPGEKEKFHNIQVVFTRENETGDQYIESLAAKIGNNYSVRVATSDSLVQLSSFRSGVLRMSARELKEDVEQAQEEMKKHYHL